MCKIRLICSQGQILGQVKRISVELVCHLVLGADLMTVVNVHVIILVWRVVFEDLLSVGADLGTNSGTHVLSHLFPILSIQMDGCNRVIVAHINQKLSSYLTKIN